MSAYADSKRRLFQWPDLKSAVLNLDDEFSLSLINDIRKEVEVFTYSVSNKSASVYSEGLTFSESGYSAFVNTPFGCKKLSGELLGRFNFSNILAVIATLISLMTREESGHIDLAKILDSISSLSSADGRMEIVNGSNEITTIVDYAHTPDALMNVLKTIADIRTGNEKVICVVGCGGDRDVGKRPLMAQFACQLSDQVILTSDNPRSEDPKKIINEMKAGLNASQMRKVISLEDRREAIKLGITLCSEGDILLIAGKGHEKYQEINGERFPFDDMAILKEHFKH